MFADSGNSGASAPIKFVRLVASLREEPIEIVENAELASGGRFLDVQLARLRSRSRTRLSATAPIEQLVMRGGLRSDALRIHGGGISPHDRLVECILHERRMGSARRKALAGWFRFR